MSLKDFTNLLMKYNLLLERHPARVFFYSSLLLKEIPISQKEKEIIAEASYFHDIGKLLIENEILNKDGPLSKEEKIIIKKHPVYSVSILSKFDFNDEVLEMILLHHERIDGKGYPFGIVNNEIPLGAKIICIADAFDSMTSWRSYRSPFPYREALEELTKCINKQFDPFLVNLFIKSFDKFKSGQIKTKLEEKSNVQKLYSQMFFHLLSENLNLELVRPLKH